MDKSRQIIGFEEAKKIKEKLQFIVDLPIKEGQIKMNKIIIVPANQNELDFFWKEFTKNGYNENSAILPFKDRPLSFLLISDVNGTLSHTSLSTYIKLHSLNIDLDEYFN